MTHGTAGHGLDIAIGIARESERDAVRRLLSAASLPESGIEDLDVLLVARSGQRIVGAAGLEWYLPQALLRSVVVSDEVRGHGVGGTLVRHALSAAAGSGVSEVVLLTLDAESFFARFGFREVKRSGISGGVVGSSEFKELCPASATAMVRSVSTTEAFGG